MQLLNLPAPDPRPPTSSPHPFPSLVAAAALSPVEPWPISARILEAARRLKASVLLNRDADPDRLADAACALTSLSADLSLLSLPQIQAMTRPVALAFWLNLYNALLIHAALSAGIRRNMMEAPNLFQRFGYQVAHLRFSLDTIEHGILRENRGHPLRLGLPQFMPWNPRLSLVLRPMDLRIHFALNCGAASCPIIRAYDPSQIDAQLTTAARSFLLSNALRIAEPPAKGVLMSRIFLWYARDFGIRPRAQFERALSFLPPDETQDLLSASSLGLRYAPLRLVSGLKLTQRPHPPPRAAGGCPLPSGR